ncbi:MAG: VWA domain-containing protein [Ignavibacteriales bacterium]|nr:VWA domain-containing protein [Ignavibacteriales bacterium]
MGIQSEIINIFSIDTEKRKEKLSDFFISFPKSPISSEMKFDKSFRLCVFLLADCSGSMAGEKINICNESIIELINSLRELEGIQNLIDICVISFGTATHVEFKPTQIKKVKYKNMIASGHTSLGQALELTCEELDNYIQSITKEQVQYIVPILALFSDGMPTDEYIKPLEKLLKKYPKSKRMALAIGKDADINILKSFANDRIYESRESNGIKSFFNG